MIDHLLLGALRDLGGRSSHFPINPTATRDQLATGVAAEGPGPHDLSPKAKAVLARSGTREDVVKQLRAEKWVRA
jgi:hypothetical protein